MLVYFFTGILVALVEQCVFVSDVYTHMYIYMYICMHTYMRVYVYIYLYIHVYITKLHTFTYICVFVYTFTDAHRCFCAGVYVCKQTGNVRGVNTHEIFVHLLIYVYL